MVSQKERESQRNLMRLEKITAVSGVGGWELIFGEDAPRWSAQIKKIHEVPPITNRRWTKP